MKKHLVRVYPSKEKLDRKDQLAWKMAEVATDSVALDSASVEMVINRLIDNASVAIASANRRPVASARAMALCHPRTGGATVFGMPNDQKFSPEWAAWANGTAVRELDYGETFVVGDNAAHAKLRDSAKILFQKVKTKWSTENLSGQALYEYAQTEAKNMGYSFITKGASGHRVGDFPHQVHYKGNLIGIEQPVTANRWILEIQIHCPLLQRGAFYEDIL